MLSLASFGVGSAKVDTRLSQQYIQAGDYLTGTVHVQGGSSSQTIDSIYLYILTQYSKGSRIKTHLFKEYHLSNSFVIHPDQRKEIPFHLPVPVDIPMSCGKYPIFLKTGLEISMAIDPTDHDRFEVLPIPVVCQVLKYIEDAGFILQAVENQFDQEKETHPFVQSFHFRPSGRFHGYIDHLTMIFDVSPNDIYVDMEITRGQSILNNTFYWNFAQPIESFRMNGHPLMKEPLLAIKEYINKGQ